MPKHVHEEEVPDLQLRAKDLALIISFAALYAALSYVSLFPVIGAVGAFITLASILAPLIGIILGPYVGALAVSIGGFVGWSVTQAGAFSFLSFVPGALTAFGSGLLFNGRRMHSAVLYSVLLLLLACYPIIGPMWLYPYYLWFQLIGLIILASPLTPLAVKSVNHNGNNITELSFGIGIISLASTLLGQMTGNLMFELTRWPSISQIESWRTGQWQLLTFVYPTERLVITLIATIIGAPLIKAIRAYGFSIGGK